MPETIDGSSAVRLGEDPIGRGQAMAQLRQDVALARTGKTMIITLRGPAGIGKTMILETFSSECRAREVLVFQNDCFAHSPIPHATLGGIIQSLGSFLLGLTPSDVRRAWSADLAFLVKLFPELADVASLVPEVILDQPIEPVEQRVRAIAALRRLFGTLGANHPVIIALDDAHYLDRDSGLLLEQLLDEGGAPFVLIVTAESAEAHDPDVLRDVLRPRGQRNVVHSTIELEPLAEPDAANVLRAFLPSFDELDENQRQRFLKDAQGIPLVLTEFARFRKEAHDHEPMTLDDILIRRMKKLSMAARALLGFLALTPGPLRVRDIAETWDDADVELALTECFDEGWIHRAGEHHEALIRLAHAAMRKPIVQEMESERIRLDHERLARTLKKNRAADGLIAFHFEKAGCIDEARPLLEKAADEAAAVGAYDLAADLYGRVLKLDNERGSWDSPVLGERWARSLTLAGRSIESGDAYLQLVQRTPGPRAAIFREYAANAYLRGGYVEKAVTGLREILHDAHVPLPDSRTMTLLRLAWNKTRQRVSLPPIMPRSPSNVDGETIHRIELVWSIVGGLGNLDPLLGAHYQQKHLTLALESGDEAFMARALATEAAFIAAAGTRAAPQVADLLVRAEKLLERQDPNTYWQAILWMMRGESAFFCGDFLKAANDLAKAEMLFSAQCFEIGWERTTTHFYELYALFYLGRFRELRIKEAKARRFARRRGDVHAATMLRSIHVATALADGDCNRATSELAIANQEWAISEVHLHHFVDMRLRAEIALYLGDPVKANAEILQGLPQFKDSMLKHVQLIRIEALHLEGRCALAMMPTDQRRNPQMKTLDRVLSSLKREKSAWADALAALLEAGLQARSGNAQAALTNLDSAIERFEALGMVLHAAVARRRRSEINAERGRSVPLSVVDQFLVDNHGIKAPERVAAMLAPGF